MIRIQIFFSVLMTIIFRLKNCKNKKNLFVTFPLDRLGRKVTSIYLNQLYSLVKIDINSKVHSETH